MYRKTSNAFFEFDAEVILNIIKLMLLLLMDFTHMSKA